MPEVLPPVNQQVKQITTEALKAVDNLYPDDDCPPPPPQDPIAEAVAGLVEKGVQMLAIDFDQTFVDCHTGGDWSRGPEALARHVRDFVPDLLVEASRRGLHVCIATFSPQTDLIRQVVEITLPADLSSKMVIKGNDRVWELPRGCEGKQAHLAAAAQEFGHISMEQICLIDDDNRNIAFARRNGVFGVYCPARERADATRQVVLEGCKASRNSSPAHNCTREPISPHHRSPMGRPDPLCTFGGSASSPPASPHSPYSPYPGMRSPVGLGSSPYHSPRSPMGVRSPMGGKGGFGSPMSPGGHRFF